MIEKFRVAVGRFRRSVAQWGLRHALGNVVRRLRHADFSDEEPGRIDVADPFDTMYGVETGGKIPASQLQTGHAFDVFNVIYYGTVSSLFRAVLRRWESMPPLRPLSDYIFVDIGSGKGRVVLLAAEHPFRACIGVELHPGLTEVASRNLARWQELGKAVSPMEVRCQEASSFDFPKTPCLVYLFNPFSGKVLSRVVESMAKAFADRPGELDVLYVNPDFNAAFEEHPGFVRLWEEPMQMSEEEAAVDILFVGNATGKKDHGEIGREICCAWRWVGLR